MKRATQRSAQLEWLLAGTLHYGASLASAVTLKSAPLCCGMLCVFEKSDFF
jgi:hypothetical protein